MPPSEENIAAMLADGAPAGIEALYDAYGTLVYTIALRILSDAHAAEDVVQECFLSVWRNTEAYQAGRGSLKAWVCGIARNRAIDRLRKSRNQRFDIPIDGAVDQPAVADTWAEVAAELNRQEIREALESLPPDQRHTIEMAYYGGFSQTEISEAMGVPLGTVKGRARLALRRLRGELSEGRQHMRAGT